ncbi:hypothetical protein WN51_05234 [Melipona quadrifasciata]|uniref:Uncharacterized protein n=1 Tax=Melipona quadrifasciata TaxID=166423 RepID=A0A0N0BDD5_9HYME|nr:hypothetical protein WN51_05234 [Melipona quadrifasciata]
MEGVEEKRRRKRTKRSGAKKGEEGRETLLAGSSGVHRCTGSSSRERIPIYRGTLRFTLVSPLLRAASEGTGASNDADVS